jgi:SAM-dependent methyltransferase
MAYDPSPFLGCAAHYLRGRPPYSAGLLDVLTAQLGLDGSGCLLDVGCGPGVLAVPLATAFSQVVAIDPDPAMLDEARRHAADSNVTNVRWIQATAEDIGGLHLGPLRVATFGQSFHWTEREAVSEVLYELLEPGGAIVLITHDIDARPAPPGTGDPPIPHAEIRELVDRFLGADRPYGGKRWLPTDRYEDALGRTRFGRPVTVHAPGREDITPDIDGVISNYLSMSFSSPPLFGGQLDLFIGELRSLLAAGTTTGRFWDWPGDTAVLISRKP